MNGKFKTRELPFKEFFENLQREYIVAELRYKIYPSERDKKYYKEREMEGKKKCIIDIAMRNNFESIFSSVTLHDKLHGEIYGECGLPNFIYRNNQDRLKRRKTDIINYFRRGSEVSVIMDDLSVEKGRIVYTDLSKSLVLVGVCGEQKYYSFNKVTRIL